LVGKANKVSNLISSETFSPTAERVPIHEPQVLSLNDTQPTKALLFLALLTKGFTCHQNQPKLKR
jgi:hypothetical protein